jgi:hypothetical protein
VPEDAVIDRTVSAPYNTVTRLPAVALELTHRSLGVRAEDAIGLPAREAE